MMMNDTYAKLPLEYPIGEMLKIYARRLLIFFIVVVVTLVANVVLLGFLLVIPKSTIMLFSSTFWGGWRDLLLLLSAFIATIMVILNYRARILTYRASQAKEVELTKLKTENDDLTKTIDEFEKERNYLKNHIPDGTYHCLLCDLDKFLLTNQFGPSLIDQIASGFEGVIESLQWLERYFGRQENVEDTETRTIYRSIIESAHHIVPKLCVYDTGSRDLPMMAGEREIREKAFNCYSRLIPHLPGPHVKDLVQNIGDWMEQRPSNDIKEGTITRILTPALQKVEEQREDLLRMLRSFWNDSPAEADARSWASQVQTTIGNISQLLSHLNPEQVFNLLLESWQNIVLSDRDIVTSHREGFIAAWQYTLSSAIDCLRTDHKNRLGETISRDWLNRYRTDTSYSAFTNIMARLRTDDSPYRPVNRVPISTGVRISSENGEGILSGETINISTTGVWFFINDAEIVGSRRRLRQSYESVTISKNGTQYDLEQISLTFISSDNSHEQITVSEALIIRVIESDPRQPTDAIGFDVQFLSNKSEYEQDLTDNLLSLVQSRE